MKKSILITLALTLVMGCKTTSPELQAEADINTWITAAAGTAGRAGAQ